MKKYLLAVIGFASCITAAEAQVVSPLQFDPGRAKAPEQLQANLRKRLGDTLSVPFFDDFASAYGNPDTARWLPGGNVYINNRFGKEPVTKGVATFDGMKANGVPYQLSTTQARLNDTLTSKPIRLGNFTINDQLSLSFYWQAGGNGSGAPGNTAGQFLQLQFLNRSGNWVEVWRQNGTGASTAFVAASIPITSADYLHNGFQFRFRNSGRPTGLVDTWNIDYVYLETQAGRNDPNNRKDAGFSMPLNSFISPYTAMPVHQFLQNPSASVTDTIRTAISNADTLDPTVLSYEGRIRNATAGFTHNFSNQTGVLLLAGEKQKQIAGNPDKMQVYAQGNTFQTIIEEFTLNNREVNTRTRFNDTIRNVTELHDYYAYDDGSAEGGFGVTASSGNLSQFAVRYKLNQPDEIQAIRVYFAQSGNAGTLNNRGLLLRIWDDANNMPAVTHKYQQSFNLQYTDSINKFYELVLTNPVQVSGTFYVGIGLINQGVTLNNLINLGIDLNAPALRNIVYNPGTGWQTYNDQGALLLRPVMQNRRISGISETATANAVTVYPNPTAGVLQVVGEVNSLQVLDMLGRAVLSRELPAATQQLDLSHMPPGLYLLHLQTPQGMLTKKIFLTR